MTIALTYPSTGELANNAVSLLVSATGVDLNSTSDQNLYAVPAGLRLIVDHITVRDASLSLTTASFGIGFNAGVSNDVIASATHTELTGNTLATNLLSAAGMKVGVGNSGDILRLKCSIAQGVAATCTVDVYGSLVL